MKIICYIATQIILLTFVFDIHSQDVDPSREKFLNFLSLALKEKEIRSILFPTPLSKYPNATKNDVYIAIDNTPFCCDSSYDIKFGKYSFHILSMESLFFYYVKCFITVDMESKKRQDESLLISICQCERMRRPEYSTFSIKYTLKKGKWQIVNLEQILPLP